MQRPFWIYDPNGRDHPYAAAFIGVILGLIIGAARCGGYLP